MNLAGGSGPNNVSLIPNIVSLSRSPRVNRTTILLSATSYQLDSFFVFTTQINRTGTL
jgi:hypothetical protein